MSKIIKPLNKIDISIQCEKMCREIEKNGIQFDAKKYPQLESYALCILEIHNLSGNYSSDFDLADNLADTDRIFRLENNLCWYYSPNGIFMYLLPTQITIPLESYEFVTRSGAVNIIKYLNSKKI